MFLGKVKWFNKEKGYGFIVPAHGGDDVFVHITEIKKLGRESLADGERVEYEIGTKKNGTCAINLVFLD